MEKDWSKLSNDFDVLQKYVAGEDVIALITARLLNLKNLGRVLELGCGNGFYTQFLEKSARKILATDISAQMSAAAEKRLSGYKTIRVQTVNAYETPYVSSSFETVFMANLIHVVDQPDKLLQESKRVLVPGGRLIISTFTTYGMDERQISAMFERYRKAFGAPPQNGSSFTPDALQNLVKSHGFEIQQADLIGEKVKSLFLAALN